MLQIVFYLTAFVALLQLAAAFMIVRLYRASDEYQRDLRLAHEEAIEKGA